MLKEVKIRNYRNFRDEIVFSLDTPNNYEFNSELIKNNIVKMASQSVSTIPSNPHLRRKMSTNRRSLVQQGIPS